VPWNCLPKTLNLSVLQCVVKKKVDCLVLCAMELFAKDFKPKCVAVCCSVLQCVVKKKVDCLDLCAMELFAKDFKPKCVAVCC